MRLLAIAVRIGNENFVRESPGAVSRDGTKSRARSGLVRVTRRSRMLRARLSEDFLPKLFPD